MTDCKQPFTVLSTITYDLLIISHSIEKYLKEETWGRDLIGENTAMMQMKIKTYQRRLSRRLRL